MKHAKQFYIKERFNPQLGTYWVACGQLSKTKARKMEGSLYGSNLMHGYDTEQEYKTRLTNLKLDGEKVQE